MSVGAAWGSNRLLSVNLNPFWLRKDLGKKCPDVDSGYSKTKSLPLRSSRRVISPFLLVKIRLPFRHASLPAPQQQLGNAVGVIDEIGRIRAVHVEINFFLFDELGELKRRGRDRDLAFDIQCGVELRGNVAHKIAKMLGDLRPN